MRMAAVFAGLTCTALQVECFAIRAKTKLGHSVCWFILCRLNVTTMCSLSQSVTAVVLRLQ